jgi:hypothetical protein
MIGKAADVFELLVGSFIHVGANIAAISRAFSGGYELLTGI